jgi:Radical SAM superfamily
MVGDAIGRGLDVRFIAQEKALLEALEDPAIRVAAFSTMERLLPRTVATARKVRDRRPGLTLVAGGRTAAPYAGELVQELFDVVVTGEADVVFAPLLASLGRGEAPRFPGVYWRDRLTGAVHQPELPALLPTAAEIEERFRVPWDVVDRQGWQTLDLFAQRGCPWSRCTFCATRERGVRALSHEAILRTIDEAPRHGIKILSFADDAFVHQPAWTRALLDEIVARRTELRFHALAIPNRTVWPMFDAMARAGFEELAFGVETLLPQRGERLRKTANGVQYVRQACESIRRCAAAGIQPVIYMILADPGSTLEEIAQELTAAAGMLASVYRNTRVLPKLSFSLTLLPVAGTDCASSYPARSDWISTGDGGFYWSAEFGYPEAVGEYSCRIAQATAGFPFARENFASLCRFLVEIGPPGAAGLSVLRSLEDELRADVDRTAHDLLQTMNGHDPGEWDGPPNLRFTPERLGGFVDGWTRLRDHLAGTCLEH